TGDGSGLIDIRALSAGMDEGDKKKDKGARVDDIMNLSGGGAFGAALAAPILAPPPLEPVDLGVADVAPPKQNKTLIFAILGGCAFIAVAIVVVAMVLAPSHPTDKTATAGTGTSALPDPMGSVAANDTSTPGATGTGSGDIPPPPGTGNAAKPGAVNP